MPRRQFLAALGATAVAAHAQQPTPAPRSTGGIAVPIGGALRYDNDDVWSRLVSLAGGKGARFAIFATAAGKPERTAGLIARALEKHGATTVHIPVAPRLLPAVVDPGGDPVLGEADAQAGGLLPGQSVWCTRRGDG